MSAICGILRFDGNDVSARAIDRMAQAMKHRGGDGIATVELGKLALGHCLLRVNREDLHEAQPIVDRDAVLVADLRLDNREELAASLGIAESEQATMPDSEMLLRAWRHWGDDCAAHLLGDFAFAIYDRARGTLLLGRDHMGQRVVQYHLGDGFFAFATDMPGLFACGGVPQRLNEGELARRLLMSAERIEGELIYSGVHPLSGGTCLKLGADGTMSITRYWEPGPGAEHVGRDDAYYLAAYRATIEEAVACRVRRLIAPPALLFSGGFDSGTIAAVAGPIVAARGWKLACFASVLPAGDTRRDARPAVEAFRDRAWIDLHYYVRGSETAYDDLEAQFDRTRRAFPPSIVRRRIGAMAGANGSRLILDGHGGDYTVNGFNPAMLGSILLRGDVIGFVREYRARMRFTGGSAVRVFGRDVLYAMVPQRARRVWRLAVNGFVPAWRRRGVRPEFARQAFASGAVDPRLLRDGFMPGPRGRDLWVEVCRQVSRDGAGSDIAEAADNLQLTRPFHDKKIVELGCALPDRLLFREGRERWLARTAFAADLPGALIDRMPGNDREQPDQLVMDAAAMPTILTALNDIQDDAAVARYIDVPELKALVQGGASAERLSERIRVNFAIRGLVAARYLAWLDRSNQKRSGP